MLRVLADSYSGLRENPIPIGRTNENISRTVVFNITAIKDIYGVGTWKILVVNPGESEYHFAENVQEDEDGNACWIVSKDETAKYGYGLVQLHYIPDSDTSHLYKSKVKHTIVYNSLHGEST